MSFCTETALQPTCPHATPAQSLEEVEKPLVDVMMDEIAEVIVRPQLRIGEAVSAWRPAVQQEVLRANRSPSEETSPAKYYDALRVAEESLRQAMLRGLGFLAINPVSEMALQMMWTPNGNLTSSREFISHVGRGRVHTGTRGELAFRADRMLRTLAQSVLFDMSDVQRYQDLWGAFTDVSYRTRDFAAQTMDHTFGPAWRALEPAQIANLQATTLSNGRKLSRRDRHILVKTQKPLNVIQSFSNANATTAEFAAIGIQGIQQALAQEGCPQEYWYPHLFANIGKIAFAAKLPFWSAQDMAIEAGQAAPDLFVARRRWPSQQEYEFVFRDPAHQNYYEQDIAAACQGIKAPDHTHMWPYTRELVNRLTKSVQIRATINGMHMPLDLPTLQLDEDRPTNVHLATTVVVGMAYADNYDLTR